LPVLLLVMSAHLKHTPMELNVQLCPTNGHPMSDLTCYRHLVGSLVYLVVTRPDIILSSPDSRLVCFRSHLGPLQSPPPCPISRHLCFLAPAPYSSSRTIMLCGLVIPWIIAHFMLTVCFLAVPSLLGRQINKQPFPVRVHRPRCEL
jgi:hypothetical protein